MKQREMDIAMVIALSISTTHWGSLTPEPLQSTSMLKHRCLGEMGKLRHMGRFAGVTQGKE